MDQGGAVFAKINSEEILSLRDFIRSKGYYSELKDCITRDDRDWVLLRRYTSRDNVPVWMPRRNASGEALSLSGSKLAELSTFCREIIVYFCIEEWIDYQHWQDGELIRFMDGSDEGWDTVSGNPEAWENECFFFAGSMEKRIAELTDNGEFTPEREQAIRIAWANKKIMSGAIEPQVSIVNMLRAIEKHFSIWLRD
ncbi:MAG: hypothetical protein HQK77_15070 [Desulfobacterales bacterium]|nr:hypothetical protein [Desulfobacterales bacterium]